MKRCLALLLALGLTLCLCACGKNDQPAYLPPVPSPAELDQPPEQVPEGSAPALYTVEPRECVEERTDENGALLAAVRLFVPQINQLPQIDAAYQQIFDELVQMARTYEDEAQQSQGGSPSPLYITGDYRLECNDGRTLSFLRKLTIDGDRVNTLQSFGETFDCATQGRLLLGGLFSVPEEDYLPRLEALAAEAVKDMSDPSLGEIDPLNFAVSADERMLVLVVDNRYIQIPLSELDDLLAPEWRAQ